MDKKLSSLYRLGGLTGGLSGFLMLVSGIWFIFGLSTISSLPSEEKFELIGRIGIYHGIGVVSTILLVPTLLAGYGLLSSDAGSRSTLGSQLRHPLAHHRIDSPLFTNCSVKLAIRISKRIDHSCNRYVALCPVGRVG